VRFLGEQEVEKPGELVVGWRNEQPIHLNEIGTVGIDYSENAGISLRNGFPSSYISIIRQNEANTVELLDELNVALDELNEGPLADANIRIQLSLDVSLHIRRGISMVQSNILLGILLATGTLYFFVNSARATLLITLTVPISLLVALLALDVLKLTLNVISLAGLAFAVGLVVDAAIAVQENRYRLRQAGVKLSGASSEGCRQVSGALFSPTLKTVAIFVPVLFVVGVARSVKTGLSATGANLQIW
jgi:HAE1 family hydrophobic/amphiphilic exporter-1